MRVGRGPSSVALGWAALVGLTLGCQTANRRASSLGPTASPAAPNAASQAVRSALAGKPAEHNAAPAPQAAISQVSYRRTLGPLRASAPVSESSDPWAGQTQLELRPLVDAVLARNRSAQAMAAAWHAASQRYPQVVSLEDPMFGSTFAPASFASNQVQPGYVLGVSQKIPWRGKRPLRGQVAQAEASSSYMDLQDLRVQLVEAAQLAFLDYYLARRQIELNAANLEQVRQFHETARSKYETNTAPQQDLLQADVELAELGRRQIELERSERIAVARINALLHLPPDAPLPPPPQALGAARVSASPEELRRLALAQRADLASLGAKIRAARASLALAYREFYPDLELFGRYDSFWQPGSQQDLRPQVGMNLNVPLYQERRRAAAREAMFRLRQQQAEYEQKIDDVNRDVQSAYEQFEAGRRIVELYNQQLLPAAERNVESARADYEGGQGDFLRLVAAQRQLISLSERRQEAVADYYRGLAQLERAVGRSLGSTASDETIPAGVPQRSAASALKLPK